MNSATSIRAVDPVGRGVIEIPCAMLKETRGLSDHLVSTQTRDVSICCLFQRGKCRADSQCRQIHADRRFVEAQREKLQRVNTCCAFCEGQATPTDVTVRLTGRATEGVPPLSISRFQSTAGSQDLAVSREAAWTDVCRLHLQSSCKYGASCRNIHICSKLGKVLLAKAAVNVNSFVPDSLRELARQPLEPCVAPVEPCLKAPMALRAKFPRLDEGSLLLPHVDLEGMVFAMPTRCSDGSDVRERYDFFSPSPIARSCCSPSPSKYCA